MTATGAISLTVKYLPKVWRSPLLLLPKDEFPSLWLIIRFHHTDPSKLNGEYCQILRIWPDVLTMDGESKGFRKE